MFEILKSTAKRVPGVAEVVRRAQRARWRKTSAQAWEAYHNTSGPEKLNIGCGIHVVNGWFNVDSFPCYPNQFYLDATRDFPFPDASFERVFSEHMIEHIPYLDGCAMLKECCRVLKPGGRIRVATPDLERIARLYLAPLEPAQQRYVDSVLTTWRSDYASRKVGVVINNIFEFDHQFIYDKDTLGEALERTGFCDVREFAPGITQDEHFRAMDVHADEDDYVRFETLVLEASKR